MKYFTKITLLYFVYFPIFWLLQKPEAEATTFTETTDSTAEFEQLLMKVSPAFLPP